MFGGSLRPGGGGRRGGGGGFGVVRERLNSPSKLKALCGPYGCLNWTSKIPWYLYHVPSSGAGFQALRLKP